MIIRIGQRLLKIMEPWPLKFNFLSLANVRKNQFSIYNFVSKFDSIRPYYDKEVNEVLKTVVADPNVINAVLSFGGYKVIKKLPAFIRLQVFFNLLS